MGEDFDTLDTIFLNLKRNIAVDEVERRTMERFALEVPALVSVVDKYGQSTAFEAKTSNICAGGAFFVTDTSVPVGTDVKMDLVLSFRTDDKIKKQKTHIDISGSVIRADERGVAVCFDKKYHISPLDG